MELVPYLEPDQNEQILILREMLEKLKKIQIAQTQT